MGYADIDEVGILIIDKIQMKGLLLVVLLVLTSCTLPANFSWSNNQGRNYLTPSPNQNNPRRCESGWAFATINSLNTRLNNQIRKSGIIAPLSELSAQVLLDCDNSNFGCLGGEPSQAFRWIFKNNITDSSCNAYQARGYTNGMDCSSKSKCHICTEKNNCTVQNNAKIYSLFEYGSLSGEADIMEEIYNWGPVACGMAATEQFKNYTSGVFADKTGTYKFNHYVSIYGWGQTTAGVKYWIAQNSYGPAWGEEGSFRIVRGQNNLGIETLCHRGSFKDTWTKDIRNETLGSSSEANNQVQAIPISTVLTPTISMYTPNYCDASWAFAVLQAIADGQLVKSSGLVVKTLSVQALLNCGVGNCQKGGDPFEALSFIHKYGVPEEGCQQYKAETPNKESCSAINNCASCGGDSIFKSNCTDVKNFKRWKISDYGSITGTAAMKMQLQNHHALICGIELTKAFRQYKGGVFSETTVAPKVNHYVEIVGFGAESGQDYWVGRSFFGSSWGLSGFFKIKMGGQNIGVESKCYWAGDLV